MFWVVGGGQGDAVPLLSDQLNWENCANLKSSTIISKDLTSN